MSIGIQPTQQSVNAAVGNIAVTLRDACNRIADFQTWVTTYGQSNLETLGFTPGDAGAVLTVASYLNTIAGVYKGTATQGSEFNFDDALSALWGGS